MILLLLPQAADNLLAFEPDPNVALDSDPPSVWDF
jgi:hypothetical protein